MRVLRSHQLLDHDERGASLVEYALLIALIAIACLVAVTYFGSNLGTNLSRSGDSIVSAH